MVNGRPVILCRPTSFRPARDRKHPNISELPKMSQNPKNARAWNPMFPNAYAYSMHTVYGMHVVEGKYEDRSPIEVILHFVVCLM